MRLLFIILLAVSSLATGAQGILTGVVTDAEEHLPLPTVSVRVLDDNGKIRKFATSRTDGRFSITIPEGTGLTLQLAKMSYATVEMPVDSLSMADTLRVEMQISAVKLAEVGVRAQRIRENGDTVTYNVGQFTRPQDRSIGEVMNRMPGLEVDGDGKVQYQGNDINRLYVEGNDIAGGRYGVITKNVQAEDVRAVEVLENHQPMQVLRGLSFSDQAAVNLKLKNSARANISAHGDLGTGYSERAHALYTGELFAMTIKGSVQNITSLMLNNTGRMLGTSNRSFFTESDGEQLSDYISPGSVNGSGNSLFNRSASFSTSTTWKDRRGGQWRLQGDYGYDHTWADRSSITTYYLPEGDRVITENRHADARTHVASLAANYELNEKTYYLNNNLTFNGSWNNTGIDITGTLANSQQASMPTYDLTNRLKIIKRFGQRHMVTFNSTNMWLHKPHSLTVDLDNSALEGGTAANYAGRVYQNAFFTDERASYGFIIKRVIVTMEGGVSAFIRHLESGISGDIALPDINTTNDMSTNYLRLFVQPRLELNLRRVSFNLKVPVNYYSYFFDGALKDRNEVFVSPSLTMQWKPNPRNTVRLTASARRSPASLDNIMHGDIMSDYRTFNAGIDDYYSSTGQSVGAGWEWRNTLRGTFADVSVRHSWNHMKYGTAQTIIGDYVINSYRAEPSNSTSTSARGTVRKSIDAINGTIALGSSFSRSTSSLYSQGNPVNRASRHFSLSPHLDVAICRWLNGTYSFVFSTDRMSLTAMPHSRIDSYRHDINLTATPGRWTINATASHNRSRLEPGVYDNRLDLSAYMRYAISKRLELTLSATNLLDRRRWVNRTFSDLGSVESISYQRGRQFLITLRIKK